MKILIVSATALEVAPFVALNYTVDILITGVGAPACMYTLTKKLQNNNYDFVIQAGIAGTFKNNFALASTFIVTHDLFADLGISENENFYTLFDAGFTDANTMPYTEGWLANDGKIQVGLPVAKGITVNTVSDNFDTTEMYKRKFDADIESMEGAAFHYVCLQEKVPFLQLRSISNFVGERSKTNWKIKEAIDGLNYNMEKIVIELLRN
jgi:futalosine hydrolase